MLTRMWLRVSDTNMLPVIATVRERFLRKIIRLGSQQDPNDPAYRERWKKAQADADSQLRGMIGMRAYQAYEYQARAVAKLRKSRRNLAPIHEEISG